uniref:Vasoactive intestinal peptide receptor 2 n=1 Tax=Electrophorus electricus TaxID=8005 RepID=A0AAY5E8P6_ELEEL
FTLKHFCFLSGHSAGCMVNFSRPRCCHSLGCWFIAGFRNQCPLLTGSCFFFSTGCQGTWDNISCWHHAEVGDVVVNACPGALKNLFGRDGNTGRIHGDCTACSNPNSSCNISPNSSLLMFYTVVKTLYTLGHSLSLIALITGSAILCLFRKLHCTRNYIHLNLFFSFILRAIAVLVKDAILFSHNENMECHKLPSLTGCKVSLIFFNYFIMANFFWLLVEGLYLHTLLMVFFSENRHFVVYLLIGWGLSHFPCSEKLLSHIVLILPHHNICDLIYGYLLHGTIQDFWLFINFILFISIIRILVQKLRCPDVGGNDQSQYRRLAKSTLLLIPLFGINYVVFVYMKEETENDTFEAKYKIFFDLGFGSFQGLVVAILYCFLNSEVRKWLSVCLKRYISRDYRLHSSSMSRSGMDHTAPFHRNSRAQSFLQTETTVV